MRKSSALFYAGLRALALRSLEHEMDVTRWPPRLAKMLMRPTTITITVRKRHRIVPNLENGYHLVDRSGGRAK